MFQKQKMQEGITGSEKSQTDPDFSSGNYFKYFWPNFCITRCECLILQAILGKPWNLGKILKTTKEITGNIFRRVFIFSATDNRL